MPTLCPECQQPIHGPSCATCGWTKRASKGAEGPGPLPPARCVVHLVDLDSLGECPAVGAIPVHAHVPAYRLVQRGSSQSWQVRWTASEIQVPFVCPQCRRAELRWNGACGGCSKLTRVYPGDVYEACWDVACPRYLHYTRVAKGPTPMPTAAEVQAFLAALRAVTGRIGQREPGDESEVEVEPLPF